MLELNVGPPPYRPLGRRGGFSSRALLGRGLYSILLGALGERLLNVAASPLLFQFSVYSAGVVLFCFFCCVSFGVSGPSFVFLF